jgi:hypothetical protein
VKLFKTAKDYPNPKEIMAQISAQKVKEREKKQSQQHRRIVMVRRRDSSTISVNEGKN